MERFHEAPPDEGVIAEIGCGHGIISQYLARRISTSQIIGFDPDTSSVGTVIISDSRWEDRSGIG